MSAPLPELPGQLDMLAYDPGKLARATDPETSHEAARTLTSAKSQRARLLAVFAARPAGLTAEEAASLAGLLTIGGHYTKRVSDLRNLGFVASTGATRLTSAGRPALVLAITPAGLTAHGAVTS